jgi:hypothetical protein
MSPAELLGAPPTVRSARRAPPPLPRAPGRLCFPLPADVLLLPIFTGDRLGKTALLFLLGPIFNFERHAYSQKIRFQTKTTHVTQANGHIDARAGDAN